MTAVLVILVGGLLVVLFVLAANVRTSERRSRLLSIHLSCDHTTASEMHNRAPYRPPPILHTFRYDEIRHTYYCTGYRCSFEVNEEVIVAAHWDPATEQWRHSEILSSDVAGQNSFWVCGRYAKPRRKGAA